MSLFRWILIGAGALLMLGLFLYAHISMSMRRRHRKEDQKKTPTTENQDNAAVEFSGLFSGRAEPSLGDDHEDSYDGDEDEFQQEAAQRTAPTENNVRSQIIVMYVVAHEGECFTGRQILAAMREHDLRYGKMKIFHKVLEINHRKESLFGIANMVEPGIFETSTWDKLQSPGLALFLQVPGPIPGVDAFDLMLETAMTLQQHLNGKLLNDIREELTTDWIDAIRLQLVSTMS